MFRFRRAISSRAAAASIASLPGAGALGLDGTETFDITVGEAVTATLRRADGSSQALAVRCRLDNAHEWRLWRAGGILPYVFQQMAA